MILIKKIVFTAFFAGYCPAAPGTAGTAVGMLLYLLEYALLGERAWIANVLLVVLLVYPCVRIADAGARFFGEKDPPMFVLDEVMGYWISMLFLPFSWPLAGLAFVIFRLLDILKPFPIRQVQELKGGLGIMCDDYVAGIFTNFILWGIVFASARLNIPIY